MTTSSEPKIHARALLELTREDALLRSALPASDLVPGEEFSVFEPRIPTPLAAAIAGCEVATLRSWGRKYGIVRWSVAGGTPAGVQWSVMDLHTLRLAVVMIDHGIHPADAVWFVGTQESPKEIALGVAMQFGALMTNPELSMLVAFHPGPSLNRAGDRVSFHQLDPNDTVGATFAQLRKRSFKDAFTIIDLRDIVVRVRSCLGIETFSRPVQ